MVSFDTVEDNTRFAAEHNADFPILSDPDRTIGKPYGVETPQGYYSRKNFYIDMEGKIARIDAKVSTGEAGANLIAALDELGVPKVEK